MDGILVGMRMENLQHNGHRGLLERVDLSVSGLVRGWDILLQISCCSRIPLAVVPTDMGHRALSLLTYILVFL